MAFVGGTRSLFFPIAVFRVYVSGCGACRLLMYLYPRLMYLIDVSTNAYLGPG